METKNQLTCKNASIAAISDTERCFIKLHEVKSLTTLSTTEIYRRISANTFPKQVVLGPKSVAWLKNEVIDWCKGRVAASRAEGF